MTCSVEGRSLIKSSGRLLEAPPAPVPPGPDGCHGWRTVMCTVHMICQWCALCTCSMTASVPPPLRGLQVGLISRAGHQGQQRRLARYAASQVPRGACCGWARGGRAASSGGLRCAPYWRVGPGRGELLSLPITRAQNSRWITAIVAYSSPSSTGLPIY